MATHKSAVKANRQAEKRRKSNRSILSAVKTSVKELEQKIQSFSTNPQGAREVLTPLLSKVQQRLMRAGNKMVINPKAAARKISRLSCAIDRVVK